MNERGGRRAIDEKKEEYFAAINHNDNHTYLLLSHAIEMRAQNENVSSEELLLLLPFQAAKWHPLLLYTIIIR